MSIDSWTLQVKSLEQVTQSVTISSSASVLQLKDAIQPVFDVASNRQRLIFQGKVLKDGKQLTEYANLQDGKVIHMVSRPPGAPSNSMNDDPQRNTPRGTSPQMFPGMFGPSEGYTFITVDANISDLGGNHQQSLATLLSGLLGGGSDRNNSTNTRTIFGSLGQSPLGLSQNTRTPTGNIGTRTRNLPTRNRRQANNFPSLLDTPRHYTSPVSALEIRLTRALAAIANIQATLEAPPATIGATQLTWTSMSNATPEQSHAIRAQLRESRSSGLAQTGLAVDRLADLMEALTPRLRQLAQDLQSGTRTQDEMTPELRRMITVIRSLSMVNHAIGNIMASSDDSSRRPGGLRSSPLGRVGRGTSATTTAPAVASAAAGRGTSATTTAAAGRGTLATTAAAVGRGTSATTTTAGRGTSAASAATRAAAVGRSTSAASAATRAATTPAASSTTADLRRRQQPSARNQSNDTANRDSSSSNKRKLKLPPLASPSSSASSSTSMATKRQKANSTNSNKDRVDSQAPSSSKSKGKEKYQPKPNGD